MAASLARNVLVFKESSRESWLAAEPLAELVRPITDLSLRRPRTCPRSSQPVRRCQAQGLSSNLMLTVALVVLFAVCVPLLKIQFQEAHDETIISNEIPEIIARSAATHRSMGSFSGLPENVRKELLAQVHYIAEIIQKTGHPRVKPFEIAWEIVFQSRQANYDPLFVASLIMAESSFRIQARSPVGAVGLMQIMPATGRYVSKIERFSWHGDSHLYNPAYNIKLGIAYLKYLERMFRGNLHNTLVAYNWGPEKLKTALRDKSQPIPSSPVNYSHKIRSRYSAWRADFRNKLPRYQYMAMNMTQG